MRSLASVPIAENMSAYLAIRSAFFLARVCARNIFLCLQKYGIDVKQGRQGQFVDFVRPAYCVGR